jgi:hypothetical protein
VGNKGNPAGCEQIREFGNPEVPLFSPSCGGKKGNPGAPSHEQKSNEVYTVSTALTEYIEGNNGWGAKAYPGRRKGRNRVRRETRAEKEAKDRRTIKDC